MANPSEGMKAAIRQALDQLDHTNDDQWTADGMPLTAVVQQLANDMTIKRSDINESAPGFERKITVVHAAPESGAADAPQDEPAEVGAVEEMRALMDHNVAESEHAIAVAQLKIKEGNAELLQARNDFNHAIRDRNRKFPPVTTAANIQNHLASEHEKKRLVAEARQGAPHTSAPLQPGRGLRRGLSPVRYVQGPDGQMVMPQQRQARSPAFVVPSQGR